MVYIFITSSVASTGESEFFPRILRWDPLWKTLWRLFQKPCGAGVLHIFHTFVHR